MGFNKLVDLVDLVDSYESLTMQMSLARAIGVPISLENKSVRISRGKEKKSFRKYSYSDR